MPKPPRTVTPGPAATTARPVPNTTRRARRAAAAGLALTGLLDLFGWPVGMRVIVRRFVLVGIVALVASGGVAANGLISRARGK